MAGSLRGTFHTSGTIISTARHRSGLGVHRERFFQPWLAAVPVPRMLRSYRREHHRIRLHPALHRGIAHQPHHPQRRRMRHVRRYTTRRSLAALAPPTVLDCALLTQLARHVHPHRTRDMLRRSLRLLAASEKVTGVGEVQQSGIRRIFCGVSTRPRPGVSRERSRTASGRSPSTITFCVNAGQCRGPCMWPMTSLPRIHSQQSLGTQR